MAPVIVARNEEARGAIEKLHIDRISSGAIARELQSYIVQVPPPARARLVASGHVVFVEERLRRDQFSVTDDAKPLRVRRRPAVGGCRIPGLGTVHDLR